jgi:hypothetical protein
MPKERKTINEKTEEEKLVSGFSILLLLAMTEQNRTEKETREQNKRQSTSSNDSFFFLRFSLSLYLCILVDRDIVVV